MDDLHRRVAALEEIASRCQCVELSDDPAPGDYLHPCRTGIGCCIDGNCSAGELVCTGTRGVDLWCECEAKETAP